MLAETGWTLTLLILLALAGAMSAGLSEGASVRTLAKGPVSGVVKARQEILHNKAAWQKFWALHTRAKGEAVKAPEVDFNKEMVVVATMGRRPTGGYAVEITQVQPTKDKLVVTISQRTPGPGSMVTQALTAPFHFVAVPKSDLKPEFVLLASGATGKATAKP